jgi:hypothetical protein
LILTYFTSCKASPKRAKLCLKTIQNELTLICTTQFLTNFSGQSTRQFKILPQKAQSIIAGKTDCVNTKRCTICYYCLPWWLESLTFNCG